MQDHAAAYPRQIIQETKQKQLIKLWAGTPLELSAECIQNNTSYMDVLNSIDRIVNYVPKLNYMEFDRKPYAYRVALLVVGIGFYGCCMSYRHWALFLIA